jgi:putative holliday junction resolvase
MKAPSGSDPMKGAVICLDHGTKKTGFASSDPLRIATRPLEAWRGAGDDPALLDHVAHLVEEHGADTVVVGMPFNMDGSVGPRGEDVLEFTRRLSTRLGGILVVTHDERLSTKDADQLLRDSGLYGEARKERRDSWSALVVLRDWIAGEAE